MATIGPLTYTEEQSRRPVAYSEGSASQARDENGTLIGDSSAQTEAYTQRFAVRGDYRMPIDDFGHATGQPQQRDSSGGWADFSNPAVYDNRQDSDTQNSNERLRFNEGFLKAPSGTRIEDLQQYMIDQGWQEPDRSHKQTFGTLLSEAGPGFAAVLGGGLLANFAMAGAAAGTAGTAAAAAPAAAVPAAASGTGLMGSIGNGALTGAAIGGAGAALRGGNVLSGALTGGLMGGIGGAAGAAATEMGASPFVAKLAGGVVSTVAGGLINSPSASDPKGPDGSTSTTTQPPPTNPVTPQAAVVSFGDLVPQFIHAPRADMQWGARLSGA